MQLTLEIKEAHVIHEPTIIDHGVGTYVAPVGSVVITLSDDVTRLAFHKDHFFDLFPGFDLDHDPESERLDGIPTDATPLMHEDDPDLDDDVTLDVTDTPEPTPEPTDMDRAADNGYPATDDDMERVDPFLTDGERPEHHTQDAPPDLNETVATDKPDDRVEPFVDADDDDLR